MLQYQIYPDFGGVGSVNIAVISDKLLILKIKNVKSMQCSTITHGINIVY